MMSSIDIATGRLAVGNLLDHDIQCAIFCGDLLLKTHVSFSAGECHV